MAINRRGFLHGVLSTPILPSVRGVETPTMARKAFYVDVGDLGPEEVAIFLKSIAEHLKLQTNELLIPYRGTEIGGVLARLTEGDEFLSGWSSDIKG